MIWDWTKHENIKVGNGMKSYWENTKVVREGFPGFETIGGSTWGGILGGGTELEQCLFLMGAGDLVVGEQVQKEMTGWLLLSLPPQFMPEQSPISPSLCIIFPFHYHFRCLNLPPWFPLNYKNTTPPSSKHL